MTMPSQTFQHALLEVQGLRKSFGGVRALDGVDFSLGAGECVALIGPNGAGKSTCFACICGQQRADSGTVRWEGIDLTALGPGERLRRGVSRTFQVAQTFEALTVQQNVQLALVAARGPAGLALLDRTHEGRAQALLSQVGLQASARQRALALPYGARKRLELAMALASEPRLLLLDEPAAGLAQAERASLMALVRELAASGMSILYTEHNMDAVFGVADRVLVLIEGRLAAQGSAREVAADPLVRARYLGESVGEAAHA